MSAITSKQRRIAVLSGKGGVGKSSVAAMIAKVFSERGSTLILDFDICGPSITTAFGIRNSALLKTASGFQPVSVSASLALLSFGSVLKPDDAVIWRGPRKRMFLDLFFNSSSEYENVIIDTPPGISEEHSFLVDKEVEAILVTTAQNVALGDTLRSIEFCLEHRIEILGIIENMSWFECGGCAMKHFPFGRGGASALAREYSIPYLGSLRIEPELTEYLDTGRFNSEYASLKTYHDMAEILTKSGIIE